jgi:hypothetical protein
VVLAHHPFVERVLEVDQLLHLALHQARDGDAGPFGDHRRDVFLGDLLVEHLHLRLDLLEAPVLLLELLLQLDDPTESQLRGLLEVSLALGALPGGSGLFEVHLQLADPVDALLLLLPVGPHPASPLLQVGELLLEEVEPFLGGGIGLLLQCGALDLELPDPTFHLVDLDRDGVDLDPETGRGLVDQVDRLVREVTARDVAVREDGGGHQRRILDPYTVVHLVALLQPAQDRDRVRDRRLLDEDGLESPLERRVLLDAHPVLVQCRGADQPELAAGEHRLQHVPRVDGPLGGPRADDRLQLVDERDDLALGVRDLLQHRLEALLELAAVLRPRDHRADVERHQPLVLEGLRHVAADDALREPLDDGRLPDAGLADQHRVVLGSPRQHLDHAPDLLVAADDRIELALARGLGEVAAEALERLEGLLRVLGGHSVAAANLGERLQHGVPRQAGVGEQPGDGTVRLQHRQQ